MTVKLSGPMVPPRDGGAPKQAVVLLHGYGSDGQDLIGLASYWRTPAAFGDEAVRRLLGLEVSERVVGLIHLGAAVSEPPTKERLPLDDVFTALP